MMRHDPAWYRRNDNYLAAALVLLRHRLNAALPEGPAAAAGTAPRAAPETGRRAPAWLRGFVGGGAGPAEEPQRLLPAGEPEPPQVEEKRLVDAVAEAGEGDPPPALVALAQTLGLSAFELDVVLLCIAVELDPHLAERMPAGGRPTFALAMSVLPDPSWDALAPSSPLRHWSLIEVDRRGGRPLTASALSVDERILNHAKGLHHLDERLAPLVRPVPALEGGLPESQREVAEAIAVALDPASPGVAMLRGVDPQSQRDVTTVAAALHEAGLFRVAADALPADVAELDRLARLWHRETLLAPLSLLIEAVEADEGAAPDGPAARVSRFVGRSGGGLVVGTRHGLSLPLTPLVERQVARPSPAEQLAAWHEALGDDPEAAGAARRMTALFDLDRASIAGAARAAHSNSSPRTLAQRLQAAARGRTCSALARLAEQVDVKAGFGDIVLPEAREAQLRQLVDQVEHRMTVLEDWGFGARMNRGLGVSALFSGESGTGKTMAAEVVASALGFDLYRIDLSAVVSKYIGETEKNLSRLFDAADLGGAVLLFDEADALFGKRSEVKDAHDRFANIEIDYLLQRMESYRGVAILTTNMKSALDPAFMRRLRFIVDFPYPGPAERRRIWQRALPEAAPKQEIDLDRLSRLDLNGAAIQSVALNAAFLAAARQSRVTTEILLEAARTEFQKFNRPVSEADFRPPPARSAA